MLTFSALLKDYRNKLGISQAELVEKLATFDSLLNNINIVTLSRWERGVTSPSLTKMYKVLKFFKINTWTFIYNISYTPNLTQVASFYKGFERIEEPHVFGVFSFSSYEQFVRSTFVEVGKDEPYIYRELLERLVFVSSHFTGGKGRAVSEKDLIGVKLMQELGRFTAIICEDAINKQIYAHGCSIIFNTKKLNAIQKKLSNNDFSINDLLDTNKQCYPGDTFSLYVSPLGLHSQSWLQFYLKTIVNQIQQHPKLDKIYIVCARRNLLPIYKNLGFELTYVIKNKNKYIVSCKIDEFITNHGLIDYIRTSFLCSRREG